ncbi:hypothetical protein K8Z61_10990 [Nocardioides sp. TRM66260-LWL]|uniref:hypothetical protein n=1 Tax=Nocardioides sp. TRM66260-LWL TaxID=2874478 RepID=UPI001CC379EF|nr:hypothetical protein [Nocardioides sp. TRM66260-LWL]MBZ5735024.1 hypothetical protein [Nocardioides sp. TRM66260-LWL]
MTDRVLAIRADLSDRHADRMVFFDYEFNGSRATQMGAATNELPSSETLFGAHYLAALAALGWRLRCTDADSAAVIDQDGQHIGWLMPCKAEAYGGRNRPYTEDVAP